MRTKATIGALSALLLLFVLPWALGAEPKKKPAPPPFRCFTEEWDNLFVVGAPVYDRANSRITWALETKDEVTVPSFEVLLADGDAVEVATVPVEFTPNGRRFKKETKLQATISVQLVALENVSIATVRKSQ